MKKLLLLFVAIITLSLSSCSFGFMGIEPEGEYISKNIDKGPFESVSVSAGMELILTQDSAVSVRVETYENIHKYIIVDLIDNSLKFSTDFGISLHNPNVKVYVNTDKIRKISGSGGTRLNLSSGWKGDALDIHMSGGSSAFGVINVNELSLSMSGGTRTDLEGTAENFKLHASGGSSCRNFGLATSNSDVSLSGGTSAHVKVSGHLSADCSGGSSVRYIGTPVVNTKLSGGASVRQTE